MIKPLNSPQLSSAKPRCGLQSISELLPRLIRQYELQAEMMKRCTQSNPVVILPSTNSADRVEQATFAWFE